MLKTENRITITGEVTNFKIKEKKSKDGKKTYKMANISIKDTLTNNYNLVTLFGRDNLTYGSKDDKKEVTLTGLKNIFLDGTDKPKGVLVTLVGSCSEFMTENNGLFESNNASFIYPCDDKSKQQSKFHALGFVESVSKIDTTSDDGRDVEKLRVKLGTYKYGKDDTITGVTFKTFYAYDEAFVALEDIEKGAVIEIGGNIINILAKYDEWGFADGKTKREYVIVKAKIKKDADDVDEDDADLYKKAKALKNGESISLKKTKDIDEEDFD